MIQTSHLSDAQLVTEVKRLVRCDHDTVARLIVHLAEMDGRTIHLAAGYPSLYKYCLGELRLCEYEAYNRIEVARAGRAFPRLFSLLEDGSLTLTSAQLLARRLTAENQDELLSEAVGRRKREVQELLARHFPKPDAKPTVRKLPQPNQMAARPEAESLPLTDGPAVNAREESPVCTPASALPSRDRPVTPLAPDRYRVTFTADAETCAMLELAKDMLRHTVPSGDTAEVMKRALKTLVEDLTRKKFAATEAPRKGRGTAAHSRYIPASVKRTVWIRDGGRCAFVASTGRRCEERGFLEFHHVESYAKGGQATPENIQLRCRAHNAYEADLEFGPRTTTRSGPSTPPRPAAVMSREAPGVFLPA